ncbi:MAG: lysophospholipid acyltransferase family protein [Rhodobacteraceae bacterium]|nr:lysophospholipid acyltransferase family protein [Paracoccaceae bacterium]
MASRFSATREISYAVTAKSRKGRVLIRSIENTTGRLRLIYRARGYDKDINAENNFWDVVTHRYGLSLDVVSGSLSNIPAEGPVVVISNHPYGILDGLMMGKILSTARTDFKILAHKVFSKAEEISSSILPISFDGTREAMAMNLKTRKDALSYINQGGAVGIFPGGSVSSPQRMFSRPMDPEWGTFSAKMILRSKATVVPVFFEGFNSRRFHMAGRMSRTLRTALLVNEFKRRINKPVKIAVGQPLSRDALEAYATDNRALMDFLRSATYELSSKPINTNEYGREF